MKKYQYIFFDFDGTLVNTRKGTRESALFALKQFNKKVEKSESIENIFCGPPLRESFQKFGLNDDEIKIAIEFYRKYQSENTIELSELFDGIRETLEILKKSGKKLIIVTAKLEQTAIKILKYLDIFKYFDLIVGATADSTRIKKSEIMSYAISCIKNSDISKSIMIGDRASDIQAGKMNNMDTIGVLYGMDSCTVLKNAGATYVAEKPKEILDVIM